MTAQCRRALYCTNATANSLKMACSIERIAPALGTEKHERSAAMVGYWTRDDRAAFATGRACPDWRPGSDLDFCLLALDESDFEIALRAPAPRRWRDGPPGRAGRGRPTHPRPGL